MGDVNMKITKLQLKKLIKEEMETIKERISKECWENPDLPHCVNRRMAPEELRRVHDEPPSREGTPSWYSAEGGVADRLQEMAEEIRGELNEIKTRLDNLERSQ